jgi:alcohol dehydrogenase
MGLTANWSYPTAIKFGAGRISELGAQCKAARIKNPLLVTDRALAACRSRRRRWIFWRRRAWAGHVFEVDANPTEANMTAGLAVSVRAGMTGLWLLAAARRWIWAR